MLVTVKIQIDIEDYDGASFKREIENLITEINPKSKLVSFKMGEKFSRSVQDNRYIDWTDEQYFINLYRLGK